MAVFVLLLWFLALAITVAAGLGKAPLWVAVLLVCLAGLIPWLLIFVHK